MIELAPSEQAHPILEGVSTPFASQGSLYKTSPLAAATQSPADGNDAGPCRPSRSRGSMRRGRRGSSTRRWAIPVISRSARVPPAAQQRRLLGTRPLSRRIEGRFARSASARVTRTARGRRIAPLLTVARARSHPRRPWPRSRFRAISSSIWSWPSRSFGSRSRSRFDERGRLWVVQYLAVSLSRPGLKMVSHDGVWRAVYDKVPPPPPHHFRGKDKITIHEDTDGDGVFDRHKTFLDGLNIVTAVARGRGGVWVLNPPYLLFYPDRNNDDVPDGDPEVHLQGFGLEDTHSVVNSLQLGPRRLALRRAGVDGHRPRDAARPRCGQRARATRWASSSGDIIPRRAGTRSSPKEAATPSASRSTPRGGSSRGTTAATRAGFTTCKGAITRRASTSTGRSRTPMPSATSRR